MELVLTQQDFGPLPRREREVFIFRNEGLLNSSYKEETCKNFFQSEPQSIFGTKQRVKSFQYQYTSSIETILKLSAFVIALVIVLT